MFLLPVASDAPVYHFPWGTISLIALCSLLLLGSTLGVLPPVEQLADDYGLVHGEGLHPVQWATSNFLHDGWVHLAGNMIFLWTFGLIVEGKIGWRRFLAVCAAIGVIECFIEQASLPGPGISLGASSVIFGLMAMALVWAPKNDVEIQYGIFMPMLVRVGSFDVPVLWLSGLMIAKEAALAWWLGFSVGSQLFHLAGAALGFGLAASMLKGGLVNCEGWDLWSVIGKERRARAVKLHTEAAVLDGRSHEMEALAPEVEKSKQTGRKVRALTRVHALLAEGKPAEALAEVRRTQQVLDGFALGQRDLSRLAEMLYDAQLWPESVDAISEYTERFPRGADLWRLMLAEIVLKRQQRPSAAVRVLTHIEPATLSPQHRRQFEQLRDTAERLIDSGVIELEGQAWA
jgi:membrane associated rhomboid family serine protease